MSNYPTVLSKQEIFDKVAEHLIAQDEPAFEEVVGCKYRTEDGLMYL